ncbi:MAG: aminomethyltransferase, partial [Solirubrobacteraceae bacterium]|nr:aminomethyltransferase [Solirubrobacteraceae bacterium]
APPSSAEAAGNVRRRVADAPSQTLKRTPLHDRHVAASARLIPFAGWEMPVHYADGIRAEHVAVRTGAGVFDVSHMGQIETTGPQAAALLQRLVSNDVDAIAVGASQYGVLCRDDGGILDDLLTYRLAPDRYLTVTNAANHERDVAWFARHAKGSDAEVDDALDRYAMLAVQGPRAREIVQTTADAPLPPRHTVAERTLAGRRALVCGTGYTGEDGVEILCSPEDAGAVWDEVVRRGAVPAGLGARDTLRLEACLPLYGNDLSEERGPIEAGLGWCCKEDTGFIGADAVCAVREAGPSERLRPFRLTGPGIPRPGNAIAGGGVVTSGTLSPCLDAGIGMGYVRADRADVGTTIEIDVRGKTREAVVAERPLYRKERDG